MKARDTSPTAIVRTRQEQLAVRFGELIDLFLKESDPSTWPGTKTQQERGDRVWAKKSAAETGRLAMRALFLMAPALSTSNLPLPPEEREEEEKRMIAEARELHRQGVAVLRRYEKR